MKILQINSVCGIRSTGRICTDIAEALTSQGHEVKIAYGREHVPAKYEKYAIRIGSDFENKLSAIHTRLTDKHAFANKRATQKFLSWAEAYSPDVLWLHNLHGYYIHVGMLFDWIKTRPQMQVKWTLHDCWAFTGHCTHFELIGCDQWQTHCTTCSQTKMYPACFLCGNCKDNFERKKAAFTGVKKMQLITPSRWLANLTRQSFLNEYPVEVIPNTIDQNVFKPTEGDFRRRLALEQKVIVLGVASVWDDRKGLHDFIKLSDMLDDRYTIVLIGLTKKQIKNLPARIVGIERTNSTTELAEIYTAADVFLNLTYEDNFPTVNLEAQACGTPCFTYRTGGSVESVPPENVVAQGDLVALREKLHELYTKIKSGEQQ